MNLFPVEDCKGCCSYKGCYNSAQNLKELSFYENKKWIYRKCDKSYEWYRL